MLSREMPRTTTIELQSVRRFMFGLLVLTAAQTACGSNGAEGGGSSADPWGGETQAGSSGDDAMPGGSTSSTGSGQSTGAEPDASSSSQGGDSETGDGPSVGEGQCHDGPLADELTDPSCLDGRYCETLPDREQDIDGLVDALNAATETDEKVAFAAEILSLGYPFGLEIIESADAGCHAMWADALGPDWPNVTAAIEFAVHECGHGWDFGSGAYQISDDVFVPVPDRDYFARSEITADAHHGRIPDAAANDVYFDPGTLSSDQGIQTTLSEWTQYNHDLATAYLLHRERDGQWSYEMQLALNFAWALPRYLAWAKQNHPEDYAHMLEDENVRASILTLWGQTVLYYERFARDTPWSPADDHTQYIEAIRDPELQQVMDEVRLAHGCDGLQ